MTTRITGYNSGLDVDALVKASLTSYQSKIDKATQNKKVLEYQQEQYKKIMTDTSDFYDKYFDVLKTGNLFSSSTYKSVSFKSDNNDATVTAEGFAGADVSNYKVAVTQLASKASHTFTADDFTNVVTSQEGVMAVKVGNKNVYVDVAFNEDTSIDMATTAKNLNTALNSNGIDVTAKYSEFSKGIVLESGQLGESVSFQAGIKENITEEEIAGGTPFGGSYTTYTGTNSKGTITKGTEIYNIDKNSNVVTVDNVQFTLKALSTTTSDNLTHLSEGDSGTTTTTTTVTTTSSADGKTTTTTTSEDGTANLTPLIEGDTGTTTTKIITDGTKTTTIAANGTKTTTLADGTTSSEHLTESQNGTTTTATTTDGTEITKKITTKSSDGTITTTKTISTKTVAGKTTTTITTSSNGTTNLQPADGTTTTNITKVITDGTKTTTILPNGTKTTVNPTIGKVTETVGTTTNSYTSATLTGSTDVTALKDKIVSFINDYNTLLSSINTKLYEERDRDYLPLTDAQREEMTDDQIEKWEKKAQTGLLRKDSDLERITSAMKSAMASVMSGSGLYLEKIGISPVDNYEEKNGMYTVDEDKLTQALEENSGNVKDLFTRSASTGDNGGIFIQLKSTLYSEFKSSTSVLAGKVGLDGTSTQYNNTLTKSIYKKKILIADLNEKFTDKETALYNKYSALETALQNLNSQQSSLSSMLGTS